MILRFREEKIRRLETLSDGGLTKDTFLVEEKDAALKELQLMRDEKGCKLEDTRFAMENIRLQEQLRKYDTCCFCACVPCALRFWCCWLFVRHASKACWISLFTVYWMSTDARVIYRLQDFHTSGEREAMIKEISDLRYQVSASLPNSSHFMIEPSNLTLWMIFLACILKTGSLWRVPDLCSWGTCWIASFPSILLLIHRFVSLALTDRICNDDRILNLSILMTDRFIPNLLIDSTFNVVPYQQKDASAVELVAERRQQELLHTQVIFSYVFISLLSMR